MREVTFIKKNAEKWKTMEHQLSHPNEISADELGEHYIQLTDDLSYARTFYPNTRTNRYLNQLAAAVHRTIYKNKRERVARFANFWRYEVPQAMYSFRKIMLFTLALFVGAIIIGFVCQLRDENIANLILGPEYVGTTLDNIDKGDPMGIYKSQDQNAMYMMISGNNIFVALRVFCMGALGAVYTLRFVLFQGVQIGVFIAFFAQRGLTWTCLSTIFIHGALELSSIVIAAGAGIAMGTSFMFPGTYTRMQAFTMAAKKGLKIAVGLVPVFAVAAIFESYVTRYYQQMPEVLKISIILFSFAFIIWYFFIYPSVVKDYKPADD
jgi:hypothetical protein